MRCIEICSAGAIKVGAENRIQVDRETCNDCLLCTQACPSQALNFYGETMTVPRSSVRQRRMGFSTPGRAAASPWGAANPCTSPTLPSAILKEARRRRINTAMETCGFCRWEALKAACEHLDTLLYDIKTMDAEKHRQYAGVSNEIILENLGRVRETFPSLPVQIRTPIVPGFNDSESAVRPILEHIRDMPNVSYEALPYHRMGSPKYEYIGRNYLLAESKLDEGVMPRINRLIQSEFSHLCPENNAAQK